MRNIGLIYLKKLIGFILSFLILSCSQKMQDGAGEICNCADPQKELPWLKELIQKAEADTTSNYLGCIWYEKHNEQDIFVTNMMLGSGGVMYWVFDCSGNHFGKHSVERCGACKYGCCLFSPKFGISLQII